MMSVLITVNVFTAFDMWLYTFFLRDFFKKRFENKWINYGVISTVTVLFIIVNSRQKFYLNFVGGIILLFCTAIFLYQGKVRTIIAYEVLYYIVVCLMECITSVITVDLLNTQHVFGQNYEYLGNPIPVIIAKMLTYIVILLLKSFLSKKKILNYEKAIRKTIFLPVTTLILLLGIQYSFAGKNSIVIFGSILLLFANVLVFYYIDEMMTAQEKNKEYALEKVQNDMKEIYYEKMEEISVEHRKYVHNLKDYLQTIGGLASQGKQEEIIELLKEMETEIESIREKKYTGNSILNALLCEKELIAQKYGVTMQIEPASYITFSFVKNYDLIVMVGNLLDNAIEAASLCEQAKEIRMFFSKEQGNFETIQIDNTYNGVLKREGEHLVSTKPEDENHGFGIKSVKKTAEKYGGVLLIEPKDKIFTSILTLSKVYYVE